MSAPLDGEEQARWRAEASSALRAATSQVDLGLHNWACFLAEQASQLSVKGLLAGIGQPSWGHDITSRYPDAVPAGTPGGHDGPEDSQQALADARSVLESVDRPGAAISS